MKLNAADLNRTHLGLMVQIETNNLFYRDMLAGVSHEAELVEERKMFDEVPEFILGRIRTELRLAHTGTVNVAGNASIHILEPKGY
ncbi:hypothetical protein [Paenarthrobacter sp. NPDC018779]|uniref:hypothetical protein n=1 Tax=Paenarthrobacter sp. NPDC018779 TaxID=3364375 RepID=UPI0037CB89A6